MKSLKRNGNSMLTLLFTIMVIVCLFDSLKLGRVAGWIPQTTMITTLLLLIVQLLQEARCALRPPEPTRSAKRRGDAVSETGAGKRQAPLAILRISFLAPLIWLFGMSAGAAVFCLVYLRWQADESWKFCLVFSFILGFSMHLAFTGILRIPLYPGVIIQFLV